MIKTTVRQKSSLVILVMFVFSLMLSILHFLSWSYEASGEMVDSANGVLTYNEDEFEVLEDFAPFVNAAMPSGQTKVGSVGGTTTTEYKGIQNAVIKGTDWLDSAAEMKMRLDPGKTGLLIRSKQTGADVEGKGFSFTNKMNGNFSIDMRIFSQYSLLTGSNGIYPKDISDGDKTIAQGSAWFDPDLTDNFEYNPFLDIRRIGIEISSASNPDKKFIVYIYSGQKYQGTSAIARVAIVGETYNDGGRPGYGVYESNGNYVAGGGYGYATPLKGTALSNVSTDTNVPETYSTTIKFDPVTMCVYGVSKTYSAVRGANGYASYTEEDVMIRNLATNNSKDDNTGTVATGLGLETLSASDFEEGYMVRMFIDSMTKDTTELTVPMPADTSLTEYSNAYYSDAVPVTLEELRSQPVAESNSDNRALDIGEAIPTTYDRYAQLVIYSVNGQSLQKSDDWTVKNSGDTAVCFDSEASLKKVSAEVDTANGTVVWSNAYVYPGEVGAAKLVSDGKAMGARLTFVSPEIHVLQPGQKLSMNIYSANESGYEYDVYLRALNWTQIGACVFLDKGEWTQVVFTNNKDTAYPLTGLQIVIQRHDNYSNAVLQEDEFFFSSISVNGATAESVGEYDITGRITICSSAKGTAAEGNTFELNTADYIIDGNFVIGYAPQSEKKAPVDTLVEFSTSLGGNGNNQILYDYASNTNQSGLGNNAYDVDPWSDVREIAITFRSKSDPSQAFTVYTSSRTAYNASVGMRVGVEGETYRNASGQMGYVDGSFYMGGQYASGSWGMYQNTNGNSWNSLALTATFMKFDPESMCVYSYAVDQTTDAEKKNPVQGDNSWILVRDLTKAGNALSTLNAADFKDYTVEMEVASMNTEWNLGLKHTHVLWWNHCPKESPGSTYWGLSGGDCETGATGNNILATPSERNCIIDIYAVSLTKDQTLEASSVILPETSGYDVTYEWVDMGIGNGGVVGEVTLQAPKIINLFETKPAMSVKYTNEDGSDTGTLAFTDGFAQFTPKGAGNYTFTCGDATKVLTFGYLFSYHDGSKDNDVLIIDGKVDLSDYAVVSEDKILVGWLIDGTLYSSEQTLMIDKNIYATPQLLGLKAEEGASIRISEENFGIRFSVIISGAEYDALRKVAQEVNVIGKLTSFGADEEIVLEKTFSDTDFLYDGGNYRAYITAADLDESEFALQYSAEFSLTFKTSDSVSHTVAGKQSAKEWRSAAEVAQKAISDVDSRLTSSQKNILQAYLPIQQKILYLENTGTSGHVQNVAASSDGKYLYHSFGTRVFKQNVVTGNTEGCVILYGDDESMHGGTVGYYNGYLYIPLVRKLSWEGVDKEIQTMLNCFVVRIPEELFAGEVDCTASNQPDIEICYVGAPIVDFSSQAYIFEGEEAWVTGGKYGVTNLIDAIAFGPKMGGETDEKTYMTFSLGTTQAVNSTYVAQSGNSVSTAQRGDADCIVFGQFDCTDIERWQWVEYSLFYRCVAEGDTSKLSAMFPEDEYTRFFDNIAFFRCGVLDWGPQGLVYDSFMDAYLVGTYGFGNDAGEDGINHKEENYDSFISLIIDPRSAPEKTQIYGNEEETGYMLAAKFGLISEKNPGICFYRDKGCWWDTGIASLGNGYYYVKDNDLSDWTSADGTAINKMKLMVFNLTPETAHVQKNPFADQG